MARFDVVCVHHDSERLKSHAVVPTLQRAMCQPAHYWVTRESQSDPIRLGLIRFMWIAHPQKSVLSHTTTLWHRVTYAVAGLSVLYFKPC